MPRCHGVKGLQIVQLSLGSKWPKVAFDPPKPRRQKNPLSHTPNTSDSYLFIHSVILPFPCVFFYTLGSAQQAFAVGFVCRLVCLTLSAAMPADVRHSELNDYRMIVKGVRGLFLMEACLHSPVGYPTSPAGVEGEGGSWEGRGGKGRGRGLAESTCRTCPEAHLSTSQRQLLSLSLSVSVTFPARLFHHFHRVWISPRPFISLPLSLSIPSL